MDETGWLWALAALAVFWSVGAYNRLVRLRAACLVALAALDARWQQQIGLIEAALAALESQAAAVPDSIALREAAQELSGQWDTLRARPLAGANQAGLASLVRSRSRVVKLWARLADPARDALAPWPAAVQQHWQQGLSECDLLARQFNAAVLAYNQALAQFPALLIARAFGFRPSEALPT